MEPPLVERHVHEGRDGTIVVRKSPVGDIETAANGELNVRNMKKRPTYYMLGWKKAECKSVLIFG